MMVVHPSVGTSLTGDDANRQRVHIMDLRDQQWRVAWRLFMALESWDPVRKKYILYRRIDEHTVDCVRYPLESIPRRIFLDTDVVSRLVRWSAHVFEHEPIPTDMEGTLAQDVEALMHVFHVGARADWDLVASAKTLEELSRTPRVSVRDELLDYGVTLVGTDSAERRFAHEFSRRLASSSLIDALPGMADRELVGHAIGLGCDVFCTCDRKTILSKRDRLGQLPIRLLAPAEWWAQVKPWAGLWT